MPRVAHMPPHWTIRPRQQARALNCKVRMVPSLTQPRRKARLKPLVSWLYEMPDVNRDMLRLISSVIRAGFSDGMNRKNTSTTTSTRMTLYKRSAGLCAVNTRPPPGDANVCCIEILLLFWARRTQRAFCLQPQYSPAARPKKPERLKAKYPTFSKCRHFPRWDSSPFSSCLRAFSANPALFRYPTFWRG